jgi:small-conductance mechanosensitive channel
MITRVCFFAIFLFFGRFFPLDSGESLPSDVNHYFSLEKLSEYRAFLKELLTLDVKKKNEEILSQIKDNFDDPYVVNLLRNLQNSYIQIEKNQDIIERNITQYEHIIDLYVVKKNRFDQTQIKQKVDLKTINDLCVEIGNLECDLKVIEKKLNALKKEDDEQNKYLEKMNMVFSDIFVLPKNAYSDVSKGNTQRNTVKAVFLQEELSDIEKYLQYLVKKVRKFEFSILDAKKHFIKESIKEIKTFFHAAKKKLDISEKMFLKEKENHKTLEKKTFESRDADLKAIDLLTKELPDERDPIQNVGSYVEKILILMKHSSSDSLEIFSLIDILSFSIQKALFKNNIIIDENKLYIHKKYTDMSYAWYLFTLKETNVEHLKSALETINPKIIKNVVSEKKLELKNILEEINLYIKLLNSILQEENKNFDLKNYRMKLKKIIDDLTVAHDLILQLRSKFRNIICIASVLEEELKTKTFWARSEYSISFFKFKNFFPEIKLFFIELKRLFVPYVKKVMYTFSFENSLSSVNISLLFFVLFGLAFLSFVYKKIISMIFMSINRMREQSYYIKKLNVILYVLSSQSIFFYFWINIFLLLYYKFILLHYTKTLFYFISMPLSVYFLNVLLKDFREEQFYEKDLDWKERLHRFFFFRFFIDSVVVLFFFRQALMSIMHTSAHEIILAIQFILIQIQLIILLMKKDYIVENIDQIHFINYNLKEMIEKYYQFFIGFLIALIVMINPYVGYGKQVFYVISRIIMTTILIPLFERFFEFIKNKSLIVFFNFEGGEAKNKIKVAKIIYTTLLAFMYLGIIFVSAYLILKGWGYDIKSSQIMSLFYQNLLPENHMLSNEKITALSISTLFIVVFHIVRAYIVSLFVNKFIFGKILHPSIISQPVQHTIMILSKYVILFSGFIIGLYAAGLQSIITKLGAIIIGIGFAIKEPFTDFFSYFIILIQRPIRVGDLVRINRLNNNDPEVTGIVRSINSRTTIIRQRNSQTIIIPNSLLLTRSICNWTFHKTGFTAIEDMYFFVAKSNDVEHVRQILIKVCEGYPVVIKNPAPLIRCEGITDLGYHMMVRVYIPIDRASDQWDISSQLRILIIKKFESEEIIFARAEIGIDIMSEKNIESKAQINHYSDQN